uniref:C2H2-type domain-containing protein n=1 Tax=Xiphophorus maculatus TaxID=8083 RepID=M3ZVJ2_XIPMA
VWQVIQQQSVKHYGMLEEFVTLVTEAVPQLLTERQRGVLLLALRAKVGVGTAVWKQNGVRKCAEEHIPYSNIFQVTLSHPTPAESQRLLQVGGFAAALLRLLPSSSPPLLLFQEVFDQRFDSALQSLLSDLLTRIEQLFPVPDFRQVPRTSLPAHPDPASQSEGGLPQLDMKVEVEVMTEDVIGQSMSEEEQEASNQSSEGGGVTTVVEGGVRSDPVRMKDSPGQSEGSQRTAISHNSRRVAHRCPASAPQVIRHLRSNRTCGSSGKPGSGALQGRIEGEPRPLRTHACFQCSSTFTTRTELVTHCRTHLTRPVYRCDQCDSAFQLQSSLTNHKQTHRLHDLSCSVCVQTFSSQTRLLRHLQTHSAEGAECIYRCLFCDQSFSDRVKLVPPPCAGVTQLRIHQRSHSSRSYQCDQCDKSYSSVTGLQSHRATHSGDNRFLCPQCGKCFKTCDGLEGHLRTHSGERPFRCPYCPKDFTAHAGLSVHVRQHTGEKPYVCTVCGKAWPSGGDLQKHMRTHTGERPYVCQECGKAFSISCHLTEHRRIHTGEKPFSCPECGKCFRRRFDLKKHLLSHSNVRPHPCTFCSKSYTRQTHLNRHLLTHRTADREVEEEAEPVEEA